jgi:hypothetical protein
MAVVAVNVRLRASAVIWKREQFSFTVIEKHRSLVVTFETSYIGYEAI